MLPGQLMTMNLGEVKVVIQNYTATGGVPPVIDDDSDKKEVQPLPTINKEEEE